MEYEKFKAMAKDMVPVIEEMKEILKKHESNNMVYVMLNANGCISLDIHGCSNRNMWRKEEGAPIKINFQEEI